jgi:hypothetical protein
MLMVGGGGNLLLVRPTIPGYIYDSFSGHLVFLRLITASPALIEHYLLAHMHFQRRLCVSASLCEAQP